MFGCDICQDVCPVNRKAQKPIQPIHKTEAIHPTGTLDLIELLELTEEKFQEQFQGTSVMRTKRVGLQKNACVALGNDRNEAAVPALTSALNSPEPLVRGHAAWALGEIATFEALSSLETAIKSETDAYVIGEIKEGLKASSDPRRTSEID